MRKVIGCLLSATILSWTSDAYSADVLACDGCDAYAMQEVALTAAPTINRTSSNDVHVVDPTTAMVRRYTVVKEVEPGLVSMYLIETSPSSSVISAAYDLHWKRQQLDAAKSNVIVPEGAITGLNSAYDLRGNTALQRDLGAWVANGLPWYSYLSAYANSWGHMITGGQINYHLFVVFKDGSSCTVAVTGKNGSTLIFGVVPGTLVDSEGHTIRESQAAHEGAREIFVSFENLGRWLRNANSLGVFIIEQDSDGNVVECHPEENRMVCKLKKQSS
ncbi:hypothetical protein [Permianibacter aggregans]|uniref:Uncharacterized protein n=1 Tax=Permianibacter aggregans TaxID=1510150 RepID=A0A4R6UTZ0_9GAMM|nr:hypothetical protein [Permianibacter aggregans]QGX39995.1 hypothetical protein E2H98_10105 [Permianibacter aggregans]TDQ49193.1 hypothetical protein EV696_105167 [Permianibacter aggregans]